MTIFRNTTASPVLWSARIAEVKQDLMTIEQLAAMHVEMVALIEQLDKMSDKRLWPAKELVRKLNSMRDSMNYSLKYLAQEVTS